MQKILIVLSLLLCASFANAATKCVNLNSETTTCSKPKYTEYQPDWTAVCNLGTTSVRGVAVCASTAAENQYDTSATITVGETNRYCWCKVTAPAPSMWVYNADMYGGANCARRCVVYCGEHIGYYPEYRKALFSTLGQ